MDVSRRREKPTNPKRDANLLSKLFFAYTAKLFLHGYKRELTEEDIYEVLPSYESQKLGQRLEKRWMQQTNEKRRSIAHILFKSFAKQYLYIYLSLVLPFSLSTLRPGVMKKFVLYFTPDHNNTAKIAACGYAAFLIFGVCVEVLYRHHIEFQLVSIALKIRAGLTSLIYRRVLKIKSTRLDEVSTGKIINLVTKDVYEFESSVLYISSFFMNLATVAILCYVLYMEVGWFFVVLLAVVVTTLSVNALLSIMVKKLKHCSLKMTDKRLQTTKEVLSAITLVKCYLWGDHYAEKLHMIRKKELGFISKIYILFFAKTIISATIIDTSWYVIVVGLILSGIRSSVGTLFLILNSINSIYLALHRTMSYAIHRMATLIAVSRRIGNFLRETDLSSRESQDKEISTQSPLLQNQVTQFELTTGITAIIGPLGSGKSFFLKSVATQHEIKDEERSFSYASQEPWLFPSTIKQNILFSCEYHHERYLEVLRVCALLDDLQFFQEGDQTVVADNGANLSKGQQARVNLARAVYKNSDVYLLDDCLAHLDVLVADYIFNECYTKFLKDKVVIIITQDGSQVNNCDRLITLENRYIKSDVWTRDKPSSIVNKHFNVDTEDSIKGETLERFQTERNIYKETKALGRVQTEVYKKYIQACGKFSGILFVVFLTAVTQAVQICITKLEANWIASEQVIFKNLTNTTIYTNALENRQRMIYIIPILVIVVAVVGLINTVFYWKLASKASAAIHKLLVSKVLNASAEFFKSHLTGNILNRFSEDILYLDEDLPACSFNLLKWIADTSGAVILAVTTNVYFVVGYIIFTVVAAAFRNIYLRTGRALKRLEFSSRNPLLGHINATLEGLSTITISKKQSVQIEQLDKLQDIYTSCSYMCLTYGKAFHFSLELCGVCLTIFTIVLFLFLDEGISSENVGLGLLQIYKISITQYYLYRNWSILENNMTAVERILKYTTHKQENKEGCFVKQWPAHGEVRYEHVHFAYNSTSCVLNDVHFVVKPKTKLAIVGRTASGKTSLTSILFRLYEIKGKIFIDNVDISTLPLDLLRSNISIVSQEPSLFSGSLRENIDPTKKFTDSEIWSALERVHMSSLFESLEEDIIGRDTKLSAGQKQLICLCRVLVRKNKIVILDEVTASVDSETENIIQSIISKDFKDCTVITVTHKFKHLLGYDQILVLDNGSVVELNKPRCLLENKNGIFYKMFKRQH